MSRIRVINAERIGFHCPGCNRMHVVAVGTGAGPRWTYNGDAELPTLSPSVLCTWSEPSDNPEEFDDPTKDVAKCCHSFVRGGQIQFLTDCTHSLAGTTVDLPPVSER